ncbi:MAG: hypothetical protein BWY57_01428 [Betaproteobacteria bacterium ADurb.Bin341]|nr:MAG: hypothetical protein BWY57_01428 [Betaproteobacteria bacterium ADurb.Bin341]
MFTREQIELAKVFFEGSSRSRACTKEHLKTLQASSEAFIDNFFDQAIHNANQASRNFISNIDEQTRRFRSAKLPYLANRGSERPRLLQE